MPRVLLLLCYLFMFFSVNGVRFMLLFPPKGGNVIACVFVCMCVCVHVCSSLSDPILMKLTERKHRMNFYYYHNQAILTNPASGTLMAPAAE